MTLKLSINEILVSSSPPASSLELCSQLTRGGVGGKGGFKWVNFGCRYVPLVS